VIQPLDGAISAVNRAFLRGYPGEVARALEELPVEEAVAFLEEQDPDSAAAAVERLTLDHGELVLAGLADGLAAAVVARIDAARAAALLARLDEATRERRLARLAAGAAREIRELIRYPADSAGSLMDPRAGAFRLDATVRDVLDRLRAAPERRMHVVYVVDAEGRLAGAVPLQDVALAEPDARLDALVLGRPASVPATAGRQEVIEEFETRRVPSLPVVDAEERMLGVIRQTALVGAAQEEASVDLQTMVGAHRDERALSPSLFAVRRRLPWLQVNLLTAFLAAAVVGLFEDTIARFTALAVLLPVVAGQSGNTGAQALAVTMRGLALREVRARHWLRVAAKEASAAALNGIAVAATTCLGVWWWSRSPGLTLVIGLSMLLSMTLAGLAGALIPMALTAARQDPAQASSIILTTVTDVVGFLSFLGIATALARLL
jgi:magnesium transporter